MLKLLLDSSESTDTGCLASPNENACHTTASSNQYLPVNNTGQSDAPFSEQVTSAGVLVPGTPQIWNVTIQLNVQ